MTNLIERLLIRKKLVIILFTVAIAVCVFLTTGVSINFDLVDYLPEDAPSTKALQIVYDEFESTIPNLRVYIPDLSITEAVEYKAKLSEPSFVDNVIWLDDIINIKEPLEMADSSIIQQWYKDGDTLFLLTISNTITESTAINELRSIAGEKAAFAGEAADHAASQEAVTKEVARIMIVVVPIILIILLIATNSWFSPILFAIVILTSIILNLGTNIIFGKISFLTQSIAPILQLAVSMDYSIFLLASFDKYKNEGLDANKAMVMAVKKTASTIIASAATTFIGFIVLILMAFKIGPDLGIVLAKGILFSMLTSLVLLPSITLASNKAIEKTSHRSLLPSFRGFGKFVVKLKIPALILLFLIIVPCYLAQGNNNFTYGSQGVGQGSRFGEDAALIDEKFGAASQLILIVPRGDISKEVQLNDSLIQLKAVSSVVSYAANVGAAIPIEFVSSDDLSQFMSKNYSRFIINVTTPSEGDAAFELVRQIRDLAGGLYPESYFLCGVSVNNYDIKLTVEKDNTIVNIAAIIAIAITILLTFRSLSLPIILLLTIESAIWINLALPYFFSDNPMHFIAYLIVNTVQLGATIDYAILFTDHYLDNRRMLSKKDSVIVAISAATPSILVSAIILALAGLSLNLISSNYIVAEFGTVLSRGAICSTLMVLILLPAFLTVFDGFIRKTTHKSKLQ